MNETVSNLASLQARLVGALIDGLIAGAIVLSIAFALGVFPKTFDSPDSSLRQNLLLSTVGIAVFLLLNGYLLIRRGQSLGKLVKGTRIVDKDGKVPSFVQIILLRYLLVAVVTQFPFIGGLFSLVDIVCIFGTERRCLHDYLAGTWVVYVSDPVDNMPRQTEEMGSQHGQDAPI